MAGGAFLRQPLIYSVLMATGTGNRCVPARQRELRTGRVIESRTLPACRVVALGAGLRELCGFMIRVRR